MREREKTMKTESAVRALVLATPLLLIGCGGSTSGDAGRQPEDMVDAYALRIQQPILDPACVRCHGPGGLRSSSPLTGYDEVLVFVKPGDAAGSELMKWITTKSMAKYATDADRAAIAAWIAEGAPRWAPANTVGPPPEPGPTRTVGMKACLVCHGTGVQFVGWLRGPHGNQEDRIGYATLPGTLESSGFPAYYGAPGLRTSPDCSASCHDPLEDGQKLSTGLSGNVPRPVVGCESCHGGGANHYGSGPIPFPRPDFTQCGQCHDKKFAHNQYHPEGDEILEKYVASPHASSLVNPAIFAAGTTNVQARCSKCHTDEGARRYKNVGGGYAALADALPDFLPPLAGATRVQCRTCHDPHDPKKLLLAEKTDGSGQRVESAEHRTCTACHQTADAIHGPASAYAWSEYQVGQGTFNASRVLYDTHFDDAATDAIEGYVLDRRSDRACRGCHDVHAADTTINRQWARSGHGGRILEAKEEAAKVVGNASPVFAAATTKHDAPAWVYYDFKEVARQGCQHCHTTTGFRNYADSLVAIARARGQNPAADVTALRYDPAKNVFGATGKQREMLYCYGCHADNAGGVRNPGPVTSAYGTLTIPYPDAGRSNVCVPCHAGRQSGQNVAIVSNFANQSFVNAHYLAAAGLLYRTIGYEYPGRDYADPPFFRHARIGTTTSATGSGQAVDTGAGGPCVGCHLDGDRPNHRFLPYQFDAADQPAAVTVVCSKCHAGDHAKTLATLETSRTRFKDALQLLETQLAKRGLHFYEAHPYFYSAPYRTDYVESGTCSDNLPLLNWKTGGTTRFTWNTTTRRCVGTIGESGLDNTGAGNLGAAFNFNLLMHEPAAWAHNRYYAKRLVYDSIDWLDDGALNLSVEATVDALPGETSYKAGARAFLLAEGGARP